MPRSLFVPDTEDTIIELVFQGTKTTPIEIDILELEALFVQASKLGKQMGTAWADQFPGIAKKELSVDISPTQASLIYDALQVQIKDLKKKLLESSKTSTTPDASDTKEKKI